MTTPTSAAPLGPEWPWVIGLGIASPGTRLTLVRADDAGVPTLHGDRCHMVRAAGDPDGRTRLQVAVAGLPDLVADTSHCGCVTQPWQFTLPHPYTGEDTVAARWLHQAGPHPAETPPVRVAALRTLLLTVPRTEHPILAPAITARVAQLDEEISAVLASNEFRHAFAFDTAFLLRAGGRPVLRRQHDQRYPTVPNPLHDGTLLGRLDRLYRGQTLAELGADELDQLWDLLTATTCWIASGLLAETSRKVALDLVDLGGGTAAARVPVTFLTRSSTAHTILVSDGTRPPDLVRDAVVLHRDLEHPGTADAICDALAAVAT